MKLYKEIFESNVKILSDETGLSSSEILECRKEDCCDCRFVLVHNAREYKLSDAEIVKFSGFTRQQLQRATEQTEQRLKRLNVRLLLEKVRKNSDLFIQNYRNSFNK